MAYLHFKFTLATAELARYTVARAWKAFLNWQFALLPSQNLGRRLLESATKQQKLLMHSLMAVHTLLR